MVLVSPMPLAIERARAPMVVAPRPAMRRSRTPKPAEKRQKGRRHPLNSFAPS